MVDTGRGAGRLYFHYKSLPRWDEERKLVYVKKPVIEVAFRKFSEAKNNENRELRLNALIDSGADWSFLPREVADALRLDIQAANQRILTIAGDTAVFTSKVYAEIQRTGKLPVPIGFLNVHVMPHIVAESKVPHFVILGRKDFFERFEITINEPSQFIMLKSINQKTFKKQQIRK